MVFTKMVRILIWKILFKVKNILIQINSSNCLICHFFLLFKQDNTRCIQSFTICVYDKNKNNNEMLRWQKSRIGDTT